MLPCRLEEEGLPDPSVCELLQSRMCALDSGVEPSCRQAFLVLFIDPVWLLYAVDCLSALRTPLKPASPIFNQQHVLTRPKGQ